MLEWLFGKKKQPEPETQQKKKPPKTQVEQQAEDKWMYEFVVQFLNSPIWRVTILDFVDTKCIVFDNQQENKFEYTTIHNQFKQLVGNLFDGMMTEIGLDEDKLIEILQKGFQSKEKKLFNQLLLCDDFLKFKDLMLRRNKALETQAFKAMNNPSNIRKSKIEKERDMLRSTQTAEQDRLRKLEEEEEQMLRKVLEMSKIQAQERQAIDKLEIEAAKLQIQKIEKEEAESKKEIEKQKEKEETKKEQPETENFEPKSRVSKHKKLNPIGGKQSDLPPLKGVNKKQNTEGKQPKKEEQEVKEYPNFYANEQEDKKEEIQQEKKEQEPKVQSQEDRKKRLMEQRQRIKKKKEQERRKMMQEQESQNAREVTNIVLQDDGIHESTIPQRQEQEQEKIPQQELQRRKAIMKKIRNRIVDDF